MGPNAQNAAPANRHPARLPLAIGIVVLTLSPPVFGQAPPSTGTAVPEFAPLAQVLLDFRNRIGCRAVTGAVSRQGKLLFSRGYGWSDAHKKKPTPPDAIMRIAGLTQPVTAAAAKNMIRHGKITLETQASPYLNLKPPRGSTPDPRLIQITIRHLLEHKGGWDAAAAFDPFTR